MTMTSEMLAAYQRNPGAMDAKIRNLFRIPENRYYSIATIEPSKKGKVFIERHRAVHSRKLSKSDA